MKRALLAFVCAFALSAPAFAGTGLTFSHLPIIIEGQAPPPSFGNATEAWIAKVGTSISGPKISGGKSAPPPGLQPGGPIVPAD
jgi:hypothetical protein